MYKSIQTLAVLLCGVQLYAQSISVEPVAFAIHRSNGGIWRWDEGPATLIGYGVQGKVTHGHWTLSNEVIGTHFFGLDNLPDHFSPEHGFSWKIQVTDSLDEFASDYTSMILSYEVNGFRAYAGKMSLDWDPAIHSMILSEKSPTFPQFGFDWQVNEKWRFAYTHGELFTGILDTSLGSTGLLGDRKVYLDRFVAIHRLEWSPFKRLTFAFNESVIYGGRGIETMYLMPFILFFSAEHYLGDTDNIQMSGDISWQPTPDMRLYGIFFMDDWDVLATFKESNANHFGWQAGVDWHSMLKEEDRLAIEATWTDHRLYLHRFKVNDYYNRDYPLGHWIGPHAQSLFAAYVFPYRRLRLVLGYNYAKRGEFTEQMLSDKYRRVHYQRFTGETETMQHLSFSVYYPLWGKFWLEAGVERLFWKHPDFDLAQPEPSQIGNVAKTSFTLSFYYNFSLPGYPVSMLP